MSHSGTTEEFSNYLFLHSFILSSLFLQSFTILKLDRNDIDNEVAKHLAEILQNNTVTLILSLFLSNSSFHSRRLSLQ